MRPSKKGTVDFSVSTGQCALRDINRPAPETAFAVHEVVAPELVERHAEIAQGAACDRFLVAPAPPFEGLRIVEAEAGAIAPREAGGFRKTFELRLVEQAATGEYVGLDEIRAADVAVEDRMLDGDELER